MTMAQIGPTFIGIEPVGGGVDPGRWPLTKAGASLYWAGLNKSKRSLTLALDKPEGREQHTDLVLSEVFGLTTTEIGRLHEARIIAGPDGR